MGRQIKKLLTALQITDIMEFKVRGFVTKYPQEKWKNNTITVKILRKLSSACPCLDTLEVHEGYINFKQVCSLISFAFIRIHWVDYYFDYLVHWFLDKHFGLSIDIEKSHFQRLPNNDATNATIVLQNWWTSSAAGGDIARKVSMVRNAWSRRILKTTAFKTAHTTWMWFIKRMRTVWKYRHTIWI